MGELVEGGSQVPIAIARAWSSVAQKLQRKQPQHRWRTVSGPMAATIATLLEEGWTPVGPLRWQDPDGTQWILDMEVPNIGLQIRHQVEQHAERRQWQVAAQHYLAQGAEQGIDFRSFQQELRNLGKGLRPHRPATATQPNASGPGRHGPQNRSRRHLAQHPQSGGRLRAPSSGRPQG